MTCCDFQGCNPIAGTCVPRAARAQRRPPPLPHVRPLHGGPAAHLLKTTLSETDPHRRGVLFGP